MKFRLQTAALCLLALSAGCASNKPKTAADVSTRAAQDGVYADSQADLDAKAGDKVFFAYDEYRLSQQARETLGKQADWLKQNPSVKIVIAGNCDERGTREYNLALGARRAESARAYLETLGVERARIATVSNGKERPFEQASNPTAWSRNRNAHTQVAAS